MAAAIPLRLDFDAALLRKHGGSRSGAARIGGVGLQIVRDGSLWFNAEGPDGLVNGKAPGEAGQKSFPAIVREIAAQQACDKP